MLLRVAKAMAVDSSRDKTPTKSLVNQRDESVEIVDTSKSPRSNSARFFPEKTDEVSGKQKTQSRSDSYRAITDRILSFSVTVWYIYGSANQKERTKLSKSARQNSF